MKILMQGRLDLNEIGGGDKVQIEQTARELEKLGVDVDISTSFSTDYKKYDIIHVFQLDWIPETYIYIKKAKKLNKKVVLSPIHHNVLEVKAFDDKYAFGLRRVSKVLFKDQHNRDTFKNIYRSIFNPKKIIPTVKSIFMGLKNMHIKSLQLSDKVLVQTELEATDLKQTYNVDIDWVKVPNGVGEQFINASSQNHQNPLPVDNYILCVGRIESRKNQLSIISAVENLRKETGKELNLVFVGRKNTKHHYEYLTKFNKEVAKDWIYHHEYIEYQKMPALYAHAKVCVSASWFETTGLTSLEALFCGTNAVASGARAEETLKGYASYCKPDDVNSIKDAIKKEFFALRPSLPKEMKTEYTWENAAKKTLRVYDLLLTNLNPK